MYRLAPVLFLAFLSSFSTFSAHAQSTDPPRSVVFAPNYPSLPENLQTPSLSLVLNRQDAGTPSIRHGEEPKATWPSQPVGYAFCNRGEITTSRISGIRDDQKRTACVRPDRARDPWLGFDKVQHVTFSFLGTLGNQYVLVNKLDVAEPDALPVSIAVTATIGLGKEVYDKKRGPRRHFSYRDLLADAVGIGLATLVIAF